MSVFRMVAVFLRSLLRTQMELAAENLALRQQLAILKLKSKRPRLRKRDRIFWAWLSRLWPSWRSALRIIVRDRSSPRFEYLDPLGADLACRNQPAGRGIPGEFPCLVILPPLNTEGSITALAATHYEQLGVAQESRDQHTM